MSPIFQNNRRLSAVVQNNKTIAGTLKNNKTTDRRSGYMNFPYAVTGAAIGLNEIIEVTCLGTAPDTFVEMSSALAQLINPVMDVIGI